MEHKRISARQLDFVEYYVQGHSGRDAATMAGFSPGNAHNAATRLLARDDIQAEIKARRAPLIQKTDITVDYLLGKLKEIIDNDVDKTSDRLKAIELAGKYLGMWDGSKSDDEDGEEAGFSTYQRVCSLVGEAA